MASINYATREISCKIVYYGPGLSGKTTNLQIIHRKIPDKDKSEMVSLATETDRTLFFDFLPLDLGSIKGFNTKFQLYTVPGQVYYNATRKLVLRGVDGVVFVVDSQSDKLQENLESFANLEENLREYGHSLETIPLVLQYNKRDLPNVYSVDELNKLVNKYRSPCYEAVAATGVGVFTTLKAIGKSVIDKFNAKYSGFQGTRRPMPAGGQAPAAAAPAAPPRAPQQPIIPARPVTPLAPANPFAAAPNPFASPAPNANPFATPSAPSFQTPPTSPFAAPVANPFANPAVNKPPLTFPAPGFGTPLNIPEPKGPAQGPLSGFSPPTGNPFQSAGLGNPAPPAGSTPFPSPFPGQMPGASQAPAPRPSPASNPFLGSPSEFRPFPGAPTSPTPPIPAMPAAPGLGFGNPAKPNVPVSPFLNSFANPNAKSESTFAPPAGLTPAANPFAAPAANPFAAPPSNPFGAPGPVASPFNAGQGFSPSSNPSPPSPPAPTINYGGFGSPPQAPLSQPNTEASGGFPNFSQSGFNPPQPRNPNLRPLTPPPEIGMPPQQQELPPATAPQASKPSPFSQFGAFEDNSGIVSTYEDMAKQDFKTKKLPNPTEKKKGFFGGLFNKDK